MKKPPPCTWLGPSPHALTYARLYPSGWWCDRHIPTWHRKSIDLATTPHRKDDTS